MCVVRVVSVWFIGWLLVVLRLVVRCSIDVFLVVLVRCSVCRCRLLWVRVLVLLIISEVRFVSFSRKVELWIRILWWVVMVILVIVVVGVDSIRV